MQETMLALCERTMDSHCEAPGADGFKRGSLRQRPQHIREWVGHGAQKNFTWKAGADDILCCEGKIYGGDCSGIARSRDTKMLAPTSSIR